MNEETVTSWTITWAAHRGLALFYLESCTSTNDLAKDAAFNEDSTRDFRLYLSSHQTTGRGRKGRSWTDNSQQNLLSSWSFLLPEPPRPTLTIRLGLALVRSAQSAFPFLNWSLKAPNDLLLNGKKIAGLLIENVTQGSKNRTIVGLGLNIMSYPNDMNHTTCLRDHLNFPMTQIHFWNFLDHWNQLLIKEIQSAQVPLQAFEQESLIYFLNQNPNHQEPVISVSPDGDLQTQQRKINWMEL